MIHKRNRLTTAERIILNTSCHLRRLKAYRDGRMWLRAISRTRYLIIERSLGLRAAVIMHECDVTLQRSGYGTAYERTQIGHILANR